MSSVKLSPLFYNSSLGLPSPDQPDLGLWTSIEFEREAIGTYGDAVMCAECDQETVWDYARRLGQEFEIADDNGECLWSGCVDEVTITCGRLEITYSMDNVYNAVKAIYFDADGNQFETDWYEDQNSIDYYGRKELILRLNEASGDEAISKVRTLLNTQSCPVPQVSLRGSESKPKAELRGISLWQKLAWEYIDCDGWRINMLNGNTAWPLGDTSANVELSQYAFNSQSTDEPWTLGDICFRIQRVGNPTDPIEVSICPTALPFPADPLDSGIPLATVQYTDTIIDENGVDTGIIDISDEVLELKCVNISPMITIEPNEGYFVKISRTGPADPENYYELQFDAVNAPEWALGDTAGTMSFERTLFYEDPGPDSEGNPAEPLPINRQNVELCKVGDPAFPPTMEIWSNGVLLGSKVVDQADVPFGDFESVSFEFDDPVPEVPVGQEYEIRISVYDGAGNLATPDPNNYYKTQYNSTRPWDYFPSGESVPRGDMSIDLIGLQQSTDAIAYHAGNSGRLTGVDIECPSGVLVHPIPAVKPVTLLDYLTDLLYTGDSDNKRLLTEISKDGRLRVVCEPDEGNYCLLDCDGRITNSAGVEICNWLMEPPKWIQMRDQAGGRVNLPLLKNDGAFLLEGTTYEWPNNEFDIRQRGSRTVGDV